MLDQSDIKVITPPKFKSEVSEDRAQDLLKLKRQQAEEEKRLRKAREKEEKRKAKEAAKRAEEEAKARRLQAEYEARHGATATQSDVQQDDETQDVEISTKTRYVKSSKKSSEKSNKSIRFSTRKRSDDN